MQGWTTDPYFRKHITFKIQGQEFRFDTAALLFSPHEIDSGSALLLKTMAGNIGTPRRILDIACNYGTIGIVLAKLNPQARVILSDKDMLATRYAAHNAQLNDAPNVEVIESIGVREFAGTTFDLIVSNIPTKIGDQAIEHDFILRPLEKLEPGSSYWFVAESQLNRLITPLSRKHQLRITEVNRQSGHLVCKIKKG